MLQRCSMLWLTECIYCSNFVYHLKDGRLKCYKCHKKISKNKLNKVLTLIDAFIENETALHTSNRLKLSYVSIQKYFLTFRILSGVISQNEYEKCKNLSCEYEEYFYIEDSKKKQKESLFEAINFLTFDYQNHIYTILLPSITKYKNDSLNDTEFKKFKRDSKLINIRKKHNNINSFWKYLEKSLLPYKGIDKKNFGFFLKEIEFKYNHTKEEAKKLLIKEYFK